MPEQEGPARAVYDHTEEERPTRRRRQIADWGVGEELFDGMPGRRFDRRGEDHRIPRGGADDGRRTIVIAEGEPLPVDAPREGPADAEFASREEAIRAREEHDAVWGGDEPFAETRYDEPAIAREVAEDDAAARPPRADGPRAGEPRAAEPPARPPRADGPRAGEPRAAEPRRSAPTSPRPADGIVRGGVEGRRTVKIGGRPAEFHSAPVRRRPARTVQERVGPRPDRIAAWAFALGLLLILIAIATANI
jgi:hypothetical protein